MADAAQVTKFDTLTIQFFKNKAQYVEKMESGEVNHGDMCFFEDDAEQLVIDETLKISKEGVLGVNTITSAIKDNTLPITSGGVFTQIGNIGALLETI